MGDKVYRARIMLIDDHSAVRQGLSLLLSQEGYFVCTASDSSRSAISFLKHDRADMALLDLSLGQDNGLDLIPYLRKSGVRVLIYSMYEDPLVIERALGAGAMGFVTKRDSSDVLLDAVASVLDGIRYVSPCCVPGVDIVMENGMHA